jgi:hypothetical protein
MKVDWCKTRIGKASTHIDSYCNINVMKVDWCKTRIGKASIDI